MFIKTLTISSGSKIIRELNFHKGINLIVDETFINEEQSTGNSVGKTTVLKLIDFCLGSNPKDIYVDPESKKDEYTLVKNYLVDKKILITLVLTEDLDNDNANKIKIERNFLSRKEIIRRIDNIGYTEEEFEMQLTKLIFPHHLGEKPTFRQIISHNIRYKNLSIDNTLKTLDAYTSDAEYESLYLFLFGCEFTKGNLKQTILTKLAQENTFKNRLENNQTRPAYETTLTLLEDDIEKLNKQKDTFNLNEDFELDLNKLNKIKYQINITSSEFNQLNIRRAIILESCKESESNKSEIDSKQLELIYQQAKVYIGKMPKEFDELQAYHNRMISEKINFIKDELPSLEKKINDKEKYLKGLLSEEKLLSEEITRGESFEELEKIIIELNEKFQKKGEYESIIKQLKDVENNVNEYNKQLNEIDEELFSGNFEDTVKIQKDKFNKFFTSISDKLYGEKYALTYDIITNRKNQRVYKFSTFNTNLSSGKKQGEISCFDMAYVLFADEENIPCLHFLLNDKKELMHDNQLVGIAELANKINVQFIASILKDKLPVALNNESNFVVKLSQKDKLFRIEENV